MTTNALEALLADQDRAVPLLAKVIYDNAGPGGSLVTSVRIAWAVRAALQGLAEQVEAALLAQHSAQVPVATHGIDADQVRATAEAMLRWCNDPTASPAVLGSILAALPPRVATPQPVGMNTPNGEPLMAIRTCSRCRHAAHGPVCFNMASDNDCSCTLITMPSVATPGATSLDADGVVRRLNQEISHTRDVIARMDIGPVDEDRAVEIGAKARYLASTVSAEPDWDRQTARAKDSYRDQVRPAVVAVLAALRKVPNG